jgi:hypothetical protein
VDHCWQFWRPVELHHKHMLLSRVPLNITYCTSVLPKLNTTSQICERKGFQIPGGGL